MSKIETQSELLERLKRDVAVGIKDLREGRYETYDETNIMRLADEISRKGRETLKRSAKKSRN